MFIIWHYCGDASVASEQVIWNLPSARVIPCRPFVKSEIDYVDLNPIKADKGRRLRVSKVYLAIFMCLCTKGVNLEIVRDRILPHFWAPYNNSPAVVACHKRFRVTIPLHFRDPISHLCRFCEKHLLNGVQCQTREHADGTSRHQLLTSAAVKTAKLHLKPDTGSQVLTYKEFTTFASQVEGAMNSRLRWSTCLDTGSVPAGWQWRRRARSTLHTYGWAQLYTISFGKGGPENISRTPPTI